MIIKRYQSYVLNNLPKLILTGIFVIFLLLLFKDPFSERTLIPNLEPYPDTIYYINRALSLVSGKGFVVEREGRSFDVPVPPLYSLYLSSFYLINRDVRFFYFANLILAITSFWFFHKICRVLFKNDYLGLFVLFLYCSNYFIYWYPTLAMAENLGLMLYLGAVLMLGLKIRSFNSIMLGLFSIGLYLTKFANFPIAGVLLFFYGLKILTETKELKQKIKYLLITGVGFAVPLFIYGIYEYISRGVNILAPFNNIAYSVFSKSSENTLESSSIGGGWTSSKYIPNNLKTYWGALNGKAMPFLWDQTPLLPKFAATPGVIGLFLGLFIKSKRLLFMALILSVSAEVLFLSSFYTNDGRYIYHAIPSLLLGFGILADFTLEKLKKTNLKYPAYGLFAVVVCFYLITNAWRFKSQIMLNLKYAETPWYYISVKELNNYFDNSQTTGDKKPIVISALPPYYIDFFSNHKYTLLPLSKGQEFPDPDRLEGVWGKNDFTNLHQLYKKKLDEGYDVYLSKYGLGNVGYLHNDFDKIFRSFKVTEVKKGCYELCNIYRVELEDLDPNK